MVARLPACLYRNGRDRVSPRSRRLMAAATCKPSCLAAGAMPGTGLPFQALMVAVSPMTKMFGLPGIGEVGLDFHTTGIIGLHAEPCGRGRGANAGGP